MITMWTLLLLNVIGLYTGGCGAEFIGMLFFEIAAWLILISVRSKR
jgi:hypothetical protein